MIGVRTVFRSDCASSFQRCQTPCPFSRMPSYHIPRSLLLSAPTSQHLLSPLALPITLSSILSLPSSIMSSNHADHPLQASHQLSSYRSSWSSHRFSTLSVNAINLLSSQSIADRVGGIVPDAAGIANIEAQPVQPNPQRQSLRFSALKHTQQSESMTELTALPSPLLKRFVLPESDLDVESAAQNPVSEGEREGWAR